MSMRDICSAPCTVEFRSSKCCRNFGLLSCYLTRLDFDRAPGLDSPDYFRQESGSGLSAAILATSKMPGHRARAYRDNIPAM